jgi:sodium-dependent phosphate cotransporter
MMAQQRKKYFLFSISLFFLLVAFLISVQWMVLSFRFLNRNVIEQIIIATSNPFTSLFIGLLVTALIQSSSTTTTMLVAMVASNTITMESAVFMVMGANIGTTVTSTFVSLGHVTRRKEFRKAIAAATVHDFFNILTATVMLPLEYYFGLLSRTASSLASFLTLGDGISFQGYFNLTSYFFFPIARFLQSLLGGLNWLGLIISIILVFISIRYIGELFKSWLIDGSPNTLEQRFFNNPFRSLFLGVFFTGVVQSSSLVSSLIVPIVASNRLSIKKAFPFIMGANIGTTLTALLASVAESEAAVSIALAHLLFNLGGVLIFFPIPYLRNIPIRFARYLGKATLKNRAFGFAYIMVVFFVVPFLLILFSRGKVFIRHYDYYQENPLNRLNQTKERSSKPITLLYKVNSFSSTPIIQLGIENRQITSEQSGDTLFLNKQLFLNVAKKDCWQGVDKDGRYITCLTDIQSPYQVNSTARCDTSYIYTKRYLHSTDKKVYKFFLDLKRKIILKQEVWGNDGKLISQEELISISKD